jgi:hypothetical protein
MQLRQVVGHRELFDALEEQRVVERDRGRLDEHPDRPPDARRQSRLAGGHQFVERDQCAHVMSATAERKRDDRAERRMAQPRVVAQAGGDELLSPVHHPARDRRDGRCRFGHQTTLGEDGELARLICRDDAPGRRRQPRLGALQQELGDLRRFERRVDGAHHVQKCVSLLDPAPQRALKKAELGGKIEARRRQ